MSGYLTDADVLAATPVSWWFHRSQTGGTLMGLFDYLSVECALPVTVGADTVFQSKDLSEWPYMENYVIRADRTLWKEEYDVEDRSDPTAVGMRALRGIMTRVRPRWVRYDLTAEVEFGIGDVSLLGVFIRGHLDEVRVVGVEEPPR